MRAFALYVGLRYTAAKRRNHFISFISLVSIIGITLGVTVLITVLSVMNGFDKELKERILGMAPHVTAYGLGAGVSDWQQLREELLNTPQVQAATPFVEGQALLSHNAWSHFALLQGIEPRLEQQALDFSAKMLQGSLLDLQAGEFNIVLGKRLAHSLAVGLGDKITLILPEASISLAGVLPRVKRFTVVGIFELGYDFDSSLALMHLADAQKLLRLPQQVSGINLRLDDLYQAAAVAQQLTNQYQQQLWFSDWTVRNGNFFKAVKLEKTLMFLLLLFIVLVATFNILATLIMVVTEKKADIAILRTLGATPKTIMAIFIVQGAYIGVLGTVLGLIFGLLLASNITAIVQAVESFFHLQLLSSEVYYISFLPSLIKWQDVLLVTVCALLMSLTFTIYPAWRAAQTPVAEALRYE